MNRIQPVGPASAYKTYRVDTPHDRMLRSTCEDTGCAAWQNGWQSLIDESTPQGQAQAAYIRHQSGRTFRERRTGAGLTVFEFESGQRCFADHKTRPEIYSVRGGDHRGNPAGLRPVKHARAQDWVEDFGEHQQRIADQIERG